jgi:ATP-binding cassette subfamily C protein CydC
MVVATIMGTATIASGIGLLGTSAYIIFKAALQPSIAEVQVAIAGVRFFGISRAGFRYLERLISHDVNLRLLADLRVWLYRAIEPLAPAQLMYAHSGDLLTRIAADVEELENLFVRVLAPPLVAVGTTTLVTLLIGTLDPRLAVVLSLSLIIAGIVLPLTARGLARDDGQAIVQTRAGLNTALIDAIQGSADLLAFGSIQAQESRVRRLNRQLIGLQFRMGTIGALSAATTGLLLNVTVLVLLLIAVPLVRSTGPDAVMLGVLLMAAMASFEAVLPLPIALQYLDNSIAAGRRIFEIIDAEPAVTDSSTPTMPSPVPTVEINHLSFEYGAEAAAALYDVSFTIPAGSRLALVGPSGAGKSTVINLLLRFWNYPVGSIKLGGVELCEMSQEDVRRAFSLVSQTTHLFNATIRENLLLARPEASDEEISRVARQAQIHQTICAFPAGYDTWIGERGMQLSSGERQRIAIARAILKDAPILLLDEPTANLDTITERRIMHQLVELMLSRTTLLVTHRLLGLDAMDQILVLDQGRLVERGTHAELLLAGGRYARMWRLQRESLP